MSYIIPNILTLGPGKGDLRKCIGMDMLAKGLVMSEVRRLEIAKRNSEEDKSPE